MEIRDTPAAYGTAVSVPDPELAEFLEATSAGGEFVLCLPQFTGTVEMDAPGQGIAPLRYAGHTFSERDTRAAFSVHALLSSIFEAGRIRLENAASYDPRCSVTGNRTVFLFGSRSNPVTLWATTERAPHKFFQFDFGLAWSIRCEDGGVFSTPDPSRLDDRGYRSHTDYGVVARFLDPEARTNFFVLAGLGSRATEGCGYFFVQNWRELAARFGAHDFAVILEFPAPVEPSNFRSVAWFPSS